MADKIDAGVHHCTEQGLTVDKIKAFLPKGTHAQVGDSIMEAILRAEEDTGLNQAYMEEQMLGNINIIKELKIGIGDYINAVKFCALKQHMTNNKAWAIVFPARYDRLIELKKLRALEGRGDSVNIDSHVLSFNKTLAVLKIDEQMFLADHLQYAPLRHFAIKKQYDLANGKDAHGNPVSANVQHLAASKLYDMVKVPEDNSLEVKIGISEEAKQVQVDLIEQLAKNAAIQQERFKQGALITDVQAIDIVIKD